VSRTGTLAIVLAFASVASLAAALACGSLPLGFTAVFDSIAFPAPGIVHDVIWNLRAPRAFAAYACGALLALAGVLLQVLLRNALADPYILGVSGGASLGALLSIAAGLSVATTNALALFGAVAALALVFGLTWRSAEWNVYRLLLTGVVLSAGLSALISLALVLAPEAQVKGMLFWLMGDLSQAGSAVPAWIVFVTVAALGVLAAMLGGTFLTIADTAARSLWAPQQLPVGVVTALIGVPAMLILLSRPRDASLH
jgi:iron complex transport system permease protein